MRRRVLLAAALLLLLAASAGAQLPPGKWWRRAEIAQGLGLTEDQQSRLDAIFRTSANDLIDLRGDVEKASVALRSELDQPQLNRGNIQRVAAHLSEARGRLFERELMMLVDMRGVLTDPQWNRMRAQLERIAADRPRGQEQQRVPPRRRQ
jgi:Heavy-metal resistance